MSQVPPPVSSPQPSGMTAADVAAAIATTATPATGTPAGLVPVAMEWGTVVSIQLGPPETLTITLGGSTVPVAGVKFMANYSPNAADTVIIWHVGTDLVVAGGMSGVVADEGPVVGDMVATIKTKTSVAWLLCDGSTFSSTTYPALFTYLGSTTLPDMRGVSPMGAGVNGIVLGTKDLTGKVISHAHTGAAHTHSHSHAGATGGRSAAHTHGDLGASSSATAGATWGVIDNVGSHNTGTESVDHTHSIGTDTTAASAANTGLYGTGAVNIPANLGVNWYIRSI